jgi:hypothetical protein
MKKIRNCHRYRRRRRRSGVAGEGWRRVEVAETIGSGTVGIAAEIETVAGIETVAEIVIGSPAAGIAAASGAAIETGTGVETEIGTIGAAAAPDGIGMKRVGAGEDQSRYY